MSAASLRKQFELADQEMEEVKQERSEWLQVCDAQYDIYQKTPAAAKQREISAAFDAYYKRKNTLKSKAESAFYVVQEAAAKIEQAKVGAEYMKLRRENGIDYQEFNYLNHFGPNHTEESLLQDALKYQTTVSEKMAEIRAALEELAAVEKEKPESSSATIETMEGYNEYIKYREMCEKLNVFDTKLETLKELKKKFQTSLEELKEKQREKRRKVSS